jgi:hypothetical protein
MELDDDLLAPKRGSGEPNYFTIDPGHAFTSFVGLVATAKRCQRSGLAWQSFCDLAKLRKWTRDRQRQRALRPLESDACPRLSLEPSFN